MISTTADAICFEPAGLIAFPRAWSWQQQLQQRLLADPGGPDALLLLEHEPCYTLGRGADSAFLQRHGADLHLYLRELEGVVIDLLAELGLQGERVEGLTGVWLEGQKVAAIGVGARRWISQHGLALNVEADLAGFAQVVPCGIADRPVGRLLDWRPELSAAALRPLLLQCFGRRFGVRLRPPTPQEALQGW